MTTDKSRADALTGEQKAALDLAVLNLKTHGDDQLLSAVKPLIEFYDKALATSHLEQHEAAPAGMPSPIWWIDHGTHGQITTRPDEAERAREAGSSVHKYHAAAQPEPPVADERAAYREVGFIVHDEMHGWHFAPTVAWTFLGKGCMLFARASSPNAAGAEGSCKTCGGTRVVDDGEITGSGGVEFENGPIKCVKDCPDCTVPAQAAEPVAIPAGYVLVPVEPTQAMLDRGYWPCTQGRGAKSVWGEMLRAIPAAPHPAQADARVGMTDEQPLDDATQRPLYKAAFNYRHEFDIFPSDELRSGAFNEFVAGWYAALTQGRNK